MIIAGIVAGGVGSRMNDNPCALPLPDGPKQFWPLGGEPMICRSVRRFLQHDGIDKMVIGVHGDYMNKMNGIVDEYFADERHRIIICKGANERNGTVMNMIAAAKAAFGEGPHYMISHDAARPFVTDEMISENIRLVKLFGAVDTVCGATDTVVMSKNGEFIDTVPPRSTVYNGQTPQSFDIDKFADLYNNMDDEARAHLTDCCAVFTNAGHRVALAKGNTMNIKVTTPVDYIIATAMVDAVE